MNRKRECIIKNKKKVRIASLALFTLLSSSSISLHREYRKELETIVKISEEERKSIYSNQVLLLQKPKDGPIKEDDNITLEVLEQVTNLRIDMDKIENLAFLANYPNLEYLTLYNA